MKITVILAHPRKGSFNHAISDTVTETLRGLGHEVIFHDLHDEKFDPVITPGEIRDLSYADALTIKHCNEIMEAEGIVIIHPNWWGQPPAILKGWIDRVLRAGVAYRFDEGDGGEGVPAGLLKARKVIVFNTADTPEERENDHFGDPLETLWKTCVFDFCGVREFVRRIFTVVVTSSPEQRRKWLLEAAEIVEREFSDYSRGHNFS